MKKIFLILFALIVGVIFVSCGNDDDTSVEKNFTNKTFTVGGIEFTMIAVEGGTFTMGATPEQGDDASNNEKPAHQVTLSNYYIGETEVTQALWKAVMGTNPSASVGNDLPVESISYEDANEFIAKLNEITGKKFRLPTEAEWEYAARGGKKTSNFKFAGSNDIDAVAWYKDNSDNKTHAVKTKIPNELGLYDMTGNVEEWCSDWFGDYDSEIQKNPQGPSSGYERIIRGGYYFSVPKRSRISYRMHDTPSSRYGNNGLRLSLSQ